jgi:hypothetical protein
MMMRPRHSRRVAGESNFEARRYEVRVADQWRSVVRTGRWVLAALALTAIAASPVAMATRTKGVSHRTTIPGQSLGSATAKCRPDSAAVAGGFQAPNFHPDNTRATVARVSSSLLGNRGVQTRAFNFGNEAGDLVSFAYCRKAAVPPKVRSDSVSLPPGAAGSVVAACPKGSEAVGGGFEGSASLTGGQLVIALTSKRLGDSRWKVEGFNGGGAPGDLIAYAYCKQAAHPLVTRSKQTTAPATEPKTFAVRCPRGGRAVAGGFDGHLDLSAGFAGAGAVTSKRGDHRTSWRTSAVGVNGQPAAITGYAYCRK